MILNTQTWSTIVQNQAIAIQTKAAALVDFTVGSILRAIIEAVAGVTLWLQALILQVMAITRAATSNGSDLDTWFADWNFYRLTARGASGYVTFSRFTPLLQAVVPVGATLQSADGTQTFVVILDMTNANYSSALNGYVLAPGVTSIACLVQATVASTASNVLANTLTVLTTPIAGVDYINNAGAFSGGSGQELDPAFRARFWLYIAALRGATNGAVAYAVASLQVGAAYTLTENYTLAGVYQPGFFFVVVDDGTGTPPTTLTASAYAAIDALRPLTSTFTVYSPAILHANVSMILGVATGYNRTAVVGLVGNALTAYINTNPLGVTLSPFRLAQVAMDVPGVTDISGFTLNGGLADLIPTPQQVTKTGTMSVS